MYKSLTFLLMAFLLGACAAWQAPAPDRPFKTIDLLVDASVMPPGWAMIDRHELAKDAHHLSVGDSAAVAFEIKETAFRKVGQEVHRYRNSAVAKSVYDDLIHLVGNVPSHWTYQSTIADESSLACYDYEGREPHPVCEWLHITKNMS